MHKATIVGGDKVPGKMAELAVAMAPEDVKVIVFRKNVPAEAYGWWYADPAAVVINVDKHVSKALEEVLEDRNGLSFRTALWYLFFNTFAHEYKHATQHDPTGDKAEKEAEAYAELQPFLWCKEYDMELPSDWGGLMEDITEFEKSLWEGDTDTRKELHPWEITQRTCIEQSLVWYDRSTGVLQQSFRQLARTTLNDGDPKWDNVLTPEPCGMDMVDQAPAQVVTDNTMAMESSAAVEPVVTTPPPVPPAPPQDNALSIPNEPTQPAMTASAPQIEITGDENIDNVSDGIVYAAVPADSTPLVAAGTAVAATPIATAPVNTQELTTTTVTPGPSPHPTGQTTDPNLEALKAAAIIELMTRIHQHVYDKCGFEPQRDPGFHLAGLVTEPIYIGDIPHIRDVLIGYDCVDQFGTPIKFAGGAIAPVAERLDNGILTGVVSSRKRLPMYVLYVNLGGIQVKRTILPQNPRKCKDDSQPAGPNNPFTKWALEAQQGIKRTVCMAPNGDHYKPEGGISSVVEQAPGGPSTWRKW